MQLKDLPEEIQEQVLALSNIIVRDLEGQPIELLDILDKAVVHGMNLEANRHNSRAENLAQTLQAFRDSVEREYWPKEGDRLTKLISLVDQCLIENKPNNIVL